MSVFTAKGKVSRNAREALRTEVLANITLDLEATNVGTYSVPMTINDETVFAEVSIVITERDPMTKVKAPRKAKEAVETEVETFVIG